MPSIAELKRAAASCRACDLDEGLERAGIDRRLAYVTNVVKHFKWEPRGKRRLHSKPNQVEIGACRRWLDAEITALRPRVIVCLGATAARALLGRAFRVTKSRGVLVPSTLTPYVVATVHPSSWRDCSDEARARAGTTTAAMGFIGLKG